MFRLVTAIAVATRIVEVLADDQRDVYLRVPAREGQAASLTRFYSAFAGNAAPATGAPTIGVPWPSEGLVLPPGHRLRTLVDALQATDQISQVVLSVLAYPVGPAVQPIPDADAVWEPLVGINPLNAPPPYR